MTINYYVNQVSFNEGRNFNDFEKETWTIGEQDIEFGGRMFAIVTPHGDFIPSNVNIIKEGPLVGLEFELMGCNFNLGEFNNQTDCYTNIEKIAIVRQPNNVWLWAYLLDEEGKTIACFCGNDDLDGLAHLCNYIENSL